MTMEFYVVRHHGAWRIRVNGKHHGEYGSRVFAINAAVMEARTAGLGAKVFSTGIVSQFSHEWQSEEGAAPLQPSSSQRTLKESMHE